ncbi:hypothetical protein B0T21DRAFT_39725 [Apiosordaria backusii]|uniref:Secreted protein n=1 Tax=Apiosordaria backusii TaxID=314023 RepID=A0AA40AXB3_9PEZI|nr:hypothetical protein B0T21DRAFT_39725 [Apiosordaria backusii]
MHKCVLMSCSLALTGSAILSTSLHNDSQNQVSKSARTHSHGRPSFPSAGHQGGCSKIDGDGHWVYPRSSLFVHSVPTNRFEAIAHKRNTAGACYRKPPKHFVP